jgi:CDP-diacylglycerol--glycerol-3-phosphate 3-phosphatidyltransferase
MVPVIFILIIKNTYQNYPFLVFIYVFTISLDFLDGYFARKLSQETEVGKILDPVADKLLVFFVVIGLIIKSDFPLWLAIPIFFRDIVILFAGLILFKTRHFIAPSIIIGKIAFTALGLLILIYIIDLNVFINLEILKRFLAVLSFGFLIWSFIEYYRIYMSIKNNEQI